MLPGEQPILNHCSTPGPAVAWCMALGSIMGPKKPLLKPQH